MSLSYNYYAHTRRAVLCIISNRYILRFLLHIIRPLLYFTFVFEIVVQKYCKNKIDFSRDAFNS